MKKDETGNAWQENLAKGMRLAGGLPAFPAKRDLPFINLASPESRLRETMHGASCPKSYN